MLHKLLLALAGRYSGLECRSCREPVAGADAFGLSEGVCSACRA